MVKPVCTPYMFWIFCSDDFFYFKHYFFKFSIFFVPDFENLHYLVHLNDNMNGTLVESN